MKAAAKLPAGTQSLPLGSIRIDGGTQPRAALDDAVVEDYRAAIEDGATFPPVVAFFDGQHYWLADGFHRWWAHGKAGREHILVVVKQGTRRDAVLYSVGANATHGLKRSNADKRRAVETLLSDEAWAKWSDGKIAERCGVSQPFVGSVRASLKTVMSQPTVRVGADGRETDVGRIGKGKGHSPEGEATPAPEPPPASAPAGETSGDGQESASEDTITLRRVGVLRAQTAIATLRTIPKNDALRKRGFQLVRDWLRDNSAEGSKEDEPPTPKLGGVGCSCASQAINLLMRIPQDDPQRKMAKKIMLDWIKANL